MTKWKLNHWCRNLKLPILKLIILIQVKYSCGKLQNIFIQGNLREKLASEISEVLPKVKIRTQNQKSQFSHNSSFLNSIIVMFCFVSSDFHIWDISTFDQKTSVNQKSDRQDKTPNTVTVKFQQHISAGILIYIFNLNKKNLNCEGKKSWNWDQILTS